MQRITLTVDDDLVAALDRHARERRYAGRSEALRDILRNLLTRQQLDGNGAEKGDGYCIATLTYVYDHRTRELGRRLTQSQHEHHDLAVATLHVHLDHESCLEVSVLRGSSKAVKKLADETTSQRGVRHGRLHVMPAHCARRRHPHGGLSREHEHIHA